MHDTSGPRLQYRRVRVVNLLICALLVLTSAQAQSGRRPPKQPTSPDPMPPAQTDPPIQPSTKAETWHRLPILVVRNLPTIGSSSIYTNIALDGCLEELKRSSAIEVSSTKDKTRKEASDYAKASTDTYVVLIQLEQDTVDVEHPSVSIIGGNPATLCVSYILFTPGTGKVKTQGRVYQGQRRGPVGLPPGSQASVDYELRRCGREAADRVLDALSFPRPPGR